MSTDSPQPWVWTDVSDGDARQFSPSAERNQGPIIETMSARFAPVATGGRALELASGTGQHAVAFARAFPSITWQPSDLDPRALASIIAHRAAAELDNLEPPLRVDLLDGNWAAPIEQRFDLIFACNVLHIAPFAVTENLLGGAARLLESNGVLAIYGPFKRHGDWVSDGNLSFDQSLRETDPGWGLRDVADVDVQARQHGLAVDEVIAMPANNSMLVLRPAAHHSASSS